MSGSTHKVYPGLLCNSIEFFNDGHNLKILSGGKVKPFDELSFMHIQIISEAIQANPEIEKELKRMHPDSEMKRIEQFAICNFSGLDYVPDIQNYVLQEGEYWDCPKKGCCLGEGIICKPLMYNGNKIIGQEIMLIKLLTTDKTNEVIASELSMPMGTFHFLKKNLYQKLNVSTKQEITIIAIHLNII
jgi:DNA-binding CsgD family transcriptional regulator